MGTIDEQKYLRQVYKTQLKQETIVETSDKRKKSARTFRGKKMGYILLNVRLTPG